MLIKFTKRLSSICGNISAFLIIVLIFITIGDITLRYLFGVSKVWIMELEWHIFSTSFLLAISYTLGTDKHIRVDIFYNNLSTYQQSIINIIGSTLLLLPWACIAFKTSLFYTYNSYLLLEATPDPAGLPYRFIIKGFLPITFFLLILQSLMIILKEILNLRIRKSMQ